MNALFRSPATPWFDHDAGGGKGGGRMAALMCARRDIAWADAAEAPGLDPAIWRIDHDCHPMRCDDFENAESPWGWTIRSRAADDEDADIVAVAFATQKRLGVSPR
jgi:hypothetical protein